MKCIKKAFNRKDFFWLKTGLYLQHSRNDYSNQQDKMQNFTSSSFTAKECISKRSNIFRFSDTGTLTPGLAGTLKRSSKAEPSRLLEHTLFTG